MTLPFVLRAKDYKAIGGYAEQHSLKLALIDWPNKMVYYHDAGGAETKVLLSHVHDEFKQVQQEMRKALKRKNN